ncbi:hypothetical protein Salat_0421100 [Sesamum alatum]|uniref:Uncharacterized protein n=1 Tax=Sesamum alatum TaxID=300844 RepID=A0AAE1Z2N7_9LAMI|nr:hypothetical protein Salat_0421100 [Sesamum alatum]
MLILVKRGLIVVRVVMGLMVRVVRGLRVVMGLMVRVVRGLRVDPRQINQPSEHQNETRRQQKRWILEGLESRQCSRVPVAPENVTTHSASNAPEGPDILPPIHEDNNEEDALEDAVVTQEQILCQETVTLRPGPSMFQQLSLSNLGLQPRLQIRAPPPMIGPQPLPSFNPPRRTSEVVNPIIMEGGYKYLDLNQNTGS